MSDMNFWAICFRNGDVALDLSDGRCHIYATRRAAREAMESRIFIEPVNIEKVAVNEL